MSWFKETACGSAEWWTSSSRGCATLVVFCLLLGLYCTRSIVRRWRNRRSYVAQSISPKDPRSTKDSSDVLEKDLPLVTEMDLKKLLLFLSEGGPSDGSPWIPVVDEHSDTLSYSAKLREPEGGGPTEYLSISVFHDCSTKELTDFYMDNEYRSKWDNTFESYELLDANEASGMEVGRFMKRFPFMRPREYVLAWRMWKEEDGSFYYFARHCTHPLAPRSSFSTRVEHYLSGWRIRRVPGMDACEVKMWHQEDTSLMAKMAFSYRIWTYMCAMEKALRKYKSDQCKRTANAVAFAQKIPAGLVELAPCPGPCLTTGLDMSLKSKATSSAMKRRKLVSRTSGKALANGVLLVGGAMLCAKRSVPLGAKIAAVYAIKKFVKPQSSAKQMQQHQSTRRLESRTFQET